MANWTRHRVTGPTVKRLRSQGISRLDAANSRVAASSSHGTTALKVRSGVKISSSAPAAPPNTLTATMMRVPTPSSRGKSWR